MRALRPLDGFAARLRARHGRRTADVPWLEAVLRPLRPPSATWHLHLGAAGARPGVTPGAGVGVAPPRRPAGARGEVTPVLLTRLERATTTERIREARTLVLHTRTRGVRVEEGAPRPATGGAPGLLPHPPATAAATAPVPPAAGPAPVPLTVARPAAAPPVTIPATPGDAPPLRLAGRAPSAPSAPPAPPPVDVDQITDSVLGALDRRLIAHRERHGGF